MTLIKQHLSDENMFFHDLNITLWNSQVLSGFFFLFGFPSDPVLFRLYMVILHLQQSTLTSVDNNFSGKC